MKLVLTSILFLIYRNWFLVKEIIGGDWPYFFPENLREVKLFPFLWTTYRGNGLGGINPTYFLQSYFNFTVFLTNKFYLPWFIGYKIFWFGMFIAVSALSSIYLTKVVFPRARVWQTIISAIIFTTNTYILMVVGGGQMGVALAYSIAPLVLAKFIRINRQPILAGLVLAVQVIWDPRIALITMIAVLGYHLFIFRFADLRFLIISSLIGIFLNIFWILPLAKSGFGLEGLGGILTGTGMAKFLSFASFSNTISLLHPNWPENIFGKTYFMRPEFLLVPLLAYSSLLFVNNQKSRKNILFFSLLALLGAFLAKGANPPFGGIYLWLFEHVPGFVLFRDPTKFYLLVVLPYSVLIPYALCKLGKMKNFFTFIFVLFWLFTIKEAVMGQLGGTFKIREVPKEYVRLKDFIYKQPEFFRTLWIPRQQRFSFNSNIHPSIEAGPLFQATNSAEVIIQLKRKESKQLLSELTVKYLIIPYDSEGEIFLKNRQYDESQRIALEKELDKISWLEKREVVEKVAVYEVANPQDRFWLDQEGEISYRMVKPTKYLITLSLPEPTTLFFSEQFSQFWFLKIDGQTIPSEKTEGALNSFRLKKAGAYSAEVYFSLTKQAQYGKIISFLTLLIVLAVFLRIS